MMNEPPADWQAIADDIRGWYAKYAKVVYQNAIEATVHRCYTLHAAAKAWRYEECAVIAVACKSGLGAAAVIRMGGTTAIRAALTKE